MIKFFRKIRQKLLTENKFTKYTLYAVGEILLVIIGILIALNINNKNQIRQERAQEKILLSRLEDDFEKTKGLLETTIMMQESVLDHSKDLINIIENKDYSVSSDSILQCLTLGGYSFHRAEIVLSTYDAMIGAGNMSILQNKDLISSLSEFSSKFKLGFEDGTLSENFLLMMSESIIDFSHLLEFEGNRQNLESTYRPTEEEKQIAIQKLYNKASFLSSLKWKTRTEANRLIWQKELLADVNIVLMFLKSKNPPINEDYLQKFIGNYQANADSIPVHFNIFLDDEQLYVNLPTGKLKLIPFAIDTFFSQTPTTQFNFDFEKDSVAGLEIIINDSQIQFAKIDNE